MTFSMVSLFHLMNTKPFKETNLNIVTIVNEIFTLLVAYQVMVLNGMSYRVD